MALFTPAVLTLIIIFVFIRHLNQAYQLFHRLIFRGLIFHLPPSDQEILSLQPTHLFQGSKLSSKNRKRLAKRGQISGTSAAADHVDLQLASIDSPLFVSSGSTRFNQLQSFFALNLMVLGLVLFEQIWICSKTQNDVVQPDGSLLPVEYGASVSSSTVALLIGALAYDLYIGLTILGDAQNAAVGGGGDGTVNGTSGPTSRYWYKITGTLGLLMFFFTFVLQSFGRHAAMLTQNFLGSDSSHYKAYVNQLAYNILSGVHAIYMKGLEAAPESSAAVDKDWITKPTSVEAMKFDQYFPLITLKILVSFICAVLSISFFCSAWRYSKLLVDKLEQNEEASQEVEEDDKPLSRFAKMKLLAESGLHYLNFFSPAMVVLLYIPPISFQLWLRLFVQDSTNPSEIFSVWRGFELFRLTVIIFAALLRLVYLREYIQLFLLSGLDLIRNLPRSNVTGGVDQTLALRIQIVLKSLFWYAPAMALQYAYPIIITLVVLAGLKLSDEYMPAGLESMGDNMNVGGWGVCFTLFGRGVSPLLQQSRLPFTANATVTSMIEKIATPTITPLTIRPLDADEFDGLDGDIDLDDQLDAATTTSTSSATNPSTLIPTTLSSFVPPNRGNILATALGFILMWSHLIWFLETLLCFTYLKFVRTNAARKSALMIAPNHIGGEEGKKGATSSVAEVNGATMKQRNNKAN